MTTKTIRQLASSHSLFSKRSLGDTIETMGFIQADPIRSPARAQDLILRQRVNDYQVGDLEKNYPQLNLEEDILYAYGFIKKDLWQLLHPRKTNRLNALEKKLLVFAQNTKEVLDSKKLERIFGRERVVNAWGGYSQAVKNALENLHYAGHLRIAGRIKGRRLYAHAVFPETNLAIEQRLEKLIMAVIHLLAPVTEKTLQAALFPLRRSVGDTKPIIKQLLKGGELERHIVEGQPYLMPWGMISEAESREEVRLLAPFDPLVWDRQRFEHLWGWAYRFEAYTPPAKRVRGYYALPLSWRDQIIGWANTSIKEGVLRVETGFVDKEPKDKEFKTALENEIDEYRTFLKL
jgi:uncharacterized protein